jgi:hypothetical protein
MVDEARARFRELLQDGRFSAFLMHEFEAAATEATMEEIAEFAFGTIIDAIHAYERQLNGSAREEEEAPDETA